MPFATLKDKIPNAENRAAIEQVVGPDGFVVRAKDHPAVLLVRIKDGQAKVVGIAP